MGAGDAHLIQLAPVTFLHRDAGSPGGGNDMAHALGPLGHQQLVQLTLRLQRLPDGVAALDQALLGLPLRGVQLLHRRKGGAGPAGPVLLPAGGTGTAVFLILTSILKTRLIHSASSDVSS